jgi:pimeloyl-ACP methyl ester carboxylesterase
MTDVLLVHGAWHGAWCWEPVLAHLPNGRAIDLPSDHPSGTFDDDVAAVRAALDEMDGPVVLCGHSYGGAVISEAGTHDKVAHLVYLTAFALDTGETVMVNAAAADPVAAAAPPAALNAAIRVEGDHLTVDPAGAAVAFYGDCEPPVDRLVPHSTAAFTGQITTPAWKTVASTYVVCTDDQAIRPEVQRFFAGRCTNTVELTASHSPMLSMPGRVAEILRVAAESTT